MVRYLVRNLLAASCALVLVVTGIDIACTDLELEVEVLAQCPCITIGDTSTVAVTLVAVVGKGREVDAEDVDVVRDEAYIICASYTVDADEMSGKAVTEPIAYFRLDKGVLPLAVIDLPSVVIAGDIHGPPWSKAELDTGIDGSCSVIKKIGLDRKILSFHTIGYAYKEDCENNQKSLFHNGNIFLIQFNSSKSETRASPLTSANLCIIRRIARISCYFCVIIGFCGTLANFRGIM